MLGIARLILWLPASPASPNRVPSSFTLPHRIPSCAVLSQFTAPSLAGSIFIECKCAWRKHIYLRWAAYLFGKWFCICQQQQQQQPQLPTPFPFHVLITSGDNLHFNLVQALCFDSHWPPAAADSDSVSVLRLPRGSIRQLPNEVCEFTFGTFQLFNLHSEWNCCILWLLLLIYCIGSENNVIKFKRRQHSRTLLLLLSSSSMLLSMEDQRKVQWAKEVHTNACTGSFDWVNR